MTQKKLAEASGVSLRMIQLYEQRAQDINRARTDAVIALARVLGCRAEDLLEQKFR
jgi:transcriptional regulator with XRE-family HTH domain